jgi:X-X-X-Leu-X-X-Gly heptad repeat protein
VVVPERAVEADDGVAALTTGVAALTTKDTKDTKEQT